MYKILQSRSFTILSPAVITVVPCFSSLLSCSLSSLPSLRNQMCSVYDLFRCRDWGWESLLQAEATLLAFRWELILPSVTAHANDFASFIRMGLFTYCGSNTLSYVRMLYVFMQFGHLCWTCFYWCSLGNMKRFRKHSKNLPVWHAQGVGIKEQLFLTWVWLCVCN